MRTCQSRLPKARKRTRKLRAGARLPAILPAILRPGRVCVRQSNLRQPRQKRGGSHRRSPPPGHQPPRSAPQPLQRATSPSRPAAEEDETKPSPQMAVMGRPVSTPMHVGVRLRYPRRANRCQTMQIRTRTIGDRPDVESWTRPLGPTRAQTLIICRLAALVPAARVLACVAERGLTCRRATESR